jgi:hypothetical protein
MNAKKTKTAKELKSKIDLFMRYYSDEFSGSQRTFLEALLDYINVKFELIEDEISEKISESNKNSNTPDGPDSMI